MIILKYYILHKHKPLGIEVSFASAILIWNAVTPSNAPGSIPLFSRGFALISVGENDMI
jgi:hypothetical protein